MSGLSYFPGLLSLRYFNGLLGVNYEVLHLCVTLILNLYAETRLG